MFKTTKMLEVEKRIGKPLEEAIKETYAREGNIERTAQALELSPDILYRYMNRLGLFIQTTKTGRELVTR